MPGWIIPAASALIGGVSNIFSGNAAAKAEQKRIQAANALLERSLVDDAELGRMLRNQTRAFNSQLQNTINTTALRSKGIANSGVVGAAAAGQIEGAKQATLAQTETDVQDRNAEIRAQMAYNIRSGQTYSDPVGDFFTGAVSGGIAGAQFNRTLGLLDELENDPFSGEGMYGEQNLMGMQSPMGPTEVADPFSYRLKPRFGLTVNNPYGG